MIVGFAQKIFPYISDVIDMKTIFEKKHKYVSLY